MLQRFPLAQPSRRQSKARSARIKQETPGKAREFLVLGGKLSRRVRQPVFGRLGSRISRFLQRARTGCHLCRCRHCGRGGTGFALAHDDASVFTAVPSKVFTPKRWHWNRDRSWWNRRLWSWTSDSLGLGRDLGDLDARVVLTMTPTLALDRLRLVGESPDLRALLLAKDRAVTDAPFSAGPATTESPSTKRTGSNWISAPFSSGRRSTRTTWPSVTRS